MVNTTTREVATTNLHKKIPLKYITTKNAERSYTILPYKIIVCSPTFTPNTKVHVVSLRAVIKVATISQKQF